MANYGIKISKPGVDASQALTENNKKNFQIISSIGCLVRSSKEASGSDTNIFLGYTIDSTQTKAYPLNTSNSGTKVYVIYANKFTD